MVSPLVRSLFFSKPVMLGSRDDTHAGIPPFLLENDDQVADLADIIEGLWELTLDDCFQDIVLGKPENASVR